MAVITSKKQGKIFGSVEVKGHTDRNTTEKKVGKPVVTDGTTVTALTGLTISENYNSIKVEVGITLPTTYGNRKKTLKEAWKFLDDELSDKMGEAKELLQEL